MAKLTLLRIANVLGNPEEAVRVINENNTRICLAIENTLSLDGTEPNQLEGDLDLNGNTLNNAVIGAEVEFEALPE
jgi:hypothetical protein